MSKASSTDSSDSGLQDGNLKRTIGLEHANAISKSLDVFFLESISVHIQGSPEGAGRKVKEGAIMHPTGETNTYIMIVFYSQKFKCVLKTVSQIKNILGTVL